MTEEKKINIKKQNSEKKVEAFFLFNFEFVTHQAIQKIVRTRPNKNRRREINCAVQLAVVFTSLM